MSATRLGALLTLILVLGTRPAAAQTPAEAIRAGVQDGQRVTITDAQGQRFQGRARHARPDTLTVVMRRGEADVPYASIVKIDRADDSNWNGALIGLAFGAGLGAVAALSADDQYRGDDPFCGVGILDDCTRSTGTERVITVAVAAGLGAALGAGIDALIHRNRSIYRRTTGRTRITASPTFGRRAAGAALSVSW